MREAIKRPFGVAPSRLLAILSAALILLGGYFSFAPNASATSDNFDVTSSGGTECGEDQVIITIINNTGTPVEGVFAVNGLGALSTFFPGTTVRPPVSLPLDGTPVSIVVSALGGNQFNQTFTYESCEPVEYEWPTSICRDGNWVLVHPGDNQAFRLNTGPILLPAGGSSNNANAVFGEYVVPAGVDTVGMANDFNETRSYTRPEDCEVVETTVPPTTAPPTTQPPVTTVPPTTAPPTTVKPPVTTVPATTTPATPPTVKPTVPPTPPAPPAPPSGNLPVTGGGSGSIQNLGLGLFLFVLGVGVLILSRKRKASELGS